MIGNMIEMIRKKRGITKTKLAEETGINIGHLTHIEKGERNPSHRALNLICKALDIPYEGLFQTYDRELTEEQKKYNYTNYVPYNQVPLFTNIEDFIECPSSYAKATFAYKMPDDSMSPAIEKDTTVFVETQGLLSNKDIGLFKVGNEMLIRRFLYRKNDIILRAENKEKEIEDVKVSSVNNFKIIGKIYE